MNSKAGLLSLAHMLDSPPFTGFMPLWDLGVFLFSKDFSFPLWFYLPPSFNPRNLILGLSHYSLSSFVTADGNQLFNMPFVLYLPVSDYLPWVLRKQLSFSFYLFSVSVSTKSKQTKSYFFSVFKFVSLSPPMNSIFTLSDSLSWPLFFPPFFFDSVFSLPLLIFFLW